MGNIKEEPKKDTAYLEGWYTAEDLQKIVVEILAGLRGENATTIELPDYLLVVFYADCDNGFALDDLAVWERERWETFKALVDTRESWPAVLKITSDFYVKMKDAGDIRKVVQSAELDELGPVFYHLMEGLPSGGILESLWGVIAVESEEPVEVLEKISEDDGWP